MSEIKAPEGQTQISVFVPARLKVELEELARLNERRLSGEVRVALREHIGREAPEYDTARPKRQQRETP